MAVRHTHLGVYGLIVSGNGVILIQKGRGPYTGKWDLPGGGIEFGESPREALVRELREETALTVLSATPRDTMSVRFTHTLPDGRQEDLHHIGIIYGVAVASLEPLRAAADGQDSRGARLVPLEEVRSLSLTPFAASALEGLVETGPSQATGQPRMEDLRSELLRRVERDQAARRAFSEFRSAHGGGVDLREEPLKSRWQEVEAVDTDNTAWIRGVIDRHGWPGKSLVGTDGAHAAWLLVQHSPHAFQEQALPLLESAVQQGEAEKRDWAYLLDRVLMGRGEPQVYGTQFIARNGALEPHPIRDPGQVDARRAGIGMEPLAEYAKRFVRM